MSNENEFGKYEAHIDSIINQYRNQLENIKKSRKEGILSTNLDNEDKNSNAEKTLKSEESENIEKKIGSIKNNNNQKISIENTHNLFTFNNNASNSESELIINSADNALTKLNPVGYISVNKSKNLNLMTKKVGVIKNTLSNSLFNEDFITNNVKSHVINNEFSNVDNESCVNKQLEILKEENFEIKAKLNNLESLNEEFRMRYELLEKESSLKRINENEIKRRVIELENEVKLSVINE